MPYSINNFLKEGSIDDVLLNIQDINYNVKYTISAFSIKTLKVRNNIIVINTSLKKIELDFQSVIESKESLVLLNNKINEIKTKKPLFVDKQMENYVEYIGTTGIQGPIGHQGVIGFQGPEGEYGNVNIIDVTSDYTIQVSDSNKMIDATSNSAISISIPDYSDEPFENGAQILIVRGGDGAVSFTSSNASIIMSSQGKLNITYKYSAATIVKKDDDQWYLFGDLS